MARAVGEGAGVQREVPVACGDARARTRNVARSNLDLAVLAPAGDKENLTTQRVAPASRAQRRRRKRPDLAELSGLRPCPSGLHAAGDRPDGSRVALRTA